MILNIGFLPLLALFSFFSGFSILIRIHLWTCWSLTLSCPSECHPVSSVTQGAGRMGNPKTCGRAKVEPCLWCRDGLSLSPGFPQDVSLRVVPGTKLQHGIYWITFKGGQTATNQLWEPELRLGSPDWSGFRHRSSRGLATLPPTIL
jgi:hypothetical protein